MNLIFDELDVKTCTLTECLCFQVSVFLVKGQTIKETSTSQNQGDHVNTGGTASHIPL